MRDAIDTLILDLLEWIGPSPRPYAETLEAWRTSCPRLPVWEEATERGLVVRHRVRGRGTLVSVSAAGAQLLCEQRHQPGRPLTPSTTEDVSPYYRRDLARVHHVGFGFHAAACAPGIIDVLAPVRARHGLVLELGCGTGLLTKELLASHHRVVATDASPAMLEIAREFLGDTAELARLALPDEPLPRADAIVGVGHPLNYLRDQGAFDRALVAIAGALRPGGLLAVDVCDLQWGRARQGAASFARVEPDWAIVTEFSVPTPDRFVREMTIFTANGDGSWRRDDERHENVLVDASLIPALLDEHGIDARVGSSFGTETLPEGLLVVTGQRR